MGQAGKLTEFQLFFLSERCRGWLGKRETSNDLHTLTHTLLHSFTHTHTHTHTHTLLHSLTHALTLFFTLMLADQILGCTRIHAVEASRVDPQQQKLQMVSQNVTFCNLLTIKESIEYSPDPSDPTKCALVLV